ncbi:MAG: ABC transporter ATP-binding protein [Gammaproteobacteria bacterium]|nr:ABC transporter ATP-binding protein [Gammaproteobacteria bacterium]
MLEVRDLQTGYGRIKILDGVNVSVASGSIVTVLGGNGTGKSTLLKALSGLIPVWAGEILFDGESIANLRPDRIVNRGLIQVTQGKEAYPAMTVEENLMVGAFTRTDKPGVRRDLERVYEYFPALQERRRQLSGTLSGGEVQMLVIGRGLMANPKMLMLDEPSAALAPQVVLNIFANVYRISQSGVTILLVEQNVRMALLLAEYGYIIRDGRILIEGPADELSGDESVKLSYLGGTVASRKPMSS